MDEDKIIRMRIKVVLVFAAFIVVVLGYYPGIGGALYYDDYSNLEGLARVEGFSSAWSFVFDGHAGPLGRPIALLSFLVHAHGWPGNSAYILLFNVLIHSVNFVIIFALGYSILRCISFSTDRGCFGVALVAALLWAVLPILASTTLISIQRMTGLSATFGLLGLLGFVRGYRIKQPAPIVLLVQVGCLGVGTLLSVLTKESGAIFPVYALVISLFLVGGREENRWVRCVRNTLISLPLLFILYYISPFNIDWWDSSLYRGFSPFERFTTQWIVLWEYLYLSFSPQAPTEFWPFHDYYGVKDLGYNTVIALFSWLCLIVFSIALIRKAPWFGFAVAWFLGGHLIESTTVMLELYFEHRNYTALYGVCLALTTLVYKTKGRIKGVVFFSFGVYILLLWVILFSITTMWGDPKRAAESWANTHPGSARAALHAVFLEMANEERDSHGFNRDYITREKHAFSLKVLDRTKQACPDCLNIRMQAFLYACKIADQDDILNRYRELHSLAPAGDISSGFIELMFGFVEVVKSEGCSLVDMNSVVRLIDELEKNPRFYFPEYGSKLYFVGAMAAEEMGASEEVVKYLDLAENVSKDALPVLQYQVYYFIGEGRFEDAEAAIKRRAYLLEENNPDFLTQAVISELHQEIKRAQGI